MDKPAFVISEATGKILKDRCDLWVTPEADVKPEPSSDEEQTASAEVQDT